MLNGGPPATADIDDCFFLYAHLPASLCLYQLVISPFFYALLTYGPRLYVGTPTTAHTGVVAVNTELSAP